MRYRRDNVEKSAKVKSDLNNARSRIEQLQDQLQRSKKRIGSLENEITMLNSKIKTNNTKISSKTKQKTIVEKHKNFAQNLFEHDLRKKDMEITRLKELLKKSSLMHKDKIEKFTKMNRYEINNFYDGIEKEFNILDSKKENAYNTLIEENQSVKNSLLEIYELLLEFVEKTTQMNCPRTLSAMSLKKPFKMIASDIEMSFLELINRIKMTKKAQGNTPYNR